MLLEPRRGNTLQPPLSMLPLSPLPLTTLTLSLMPLIMQLLGNVLHTIAASSMTAATREAHNPGEHRPAPTNRRRKVSAWPRCCW